MDCIAESLEMGDLSLAEEFDGIAYIGIIHKAQNVIIGDSCLLFRGEVLVEIGKNVTFDTDIGGGEGRAACGLRINARCVINEIGVKA